MRLKKFILVVCSFWCCCAFAQDKSNRGKEFWLAYGFDYSFFNEMPVNFQELAIYVSAEQAATVTVTITNTGYSQTLNIPANSVDATILIPKSGVNDARTLTDGLQNRNIHIVSDVPVAVYAHVYSTQVSGATMLMPVDTYGYSYYSINYYQTTSQSSPGDWYSWFYAVASEDNTRLEITPSDTTKNGWLPGQTYTVNLNKGESYHVFGKAIFNGNPTFASKDLTGSKIISVPGADASCHPIGVFSGSGGIRFCRGDGGEFMHQQVFPAQAWGTRYLTYHTINNPNTNINETFRNYYRVCVLDPTTVVKRNGVVMTGLIKNFFYEYMDSTGGDYITANNPILISQYTPNKNQCWNFPTTNPSPPSYGDPEMFYLSPIEQGQKSVLFYTSRKSGIDYVYANIHLPVSALNSLRVDGISIPSSQVVTHPNNPNYAVALARFIGPAAQHTIVCDSTFTSTVYGLGNYESYGYNVGTLINNLNNYSAIQNTFNTSATTDTFSCPNTPFRIFIKLAYQANSIQWKLSQVTGILPNTDSIINNPVPIRTEVINGRTYYVYTLQQDFTIKNPGTYYIPVTYAAAVIQNCSQSETATVKVEIKLGPVADFSISNNTCLNDTITLTGTASSALFNITSYKWTFDDNTNATTSSIKKKFTTAGLQNINFKIFASNGCVGDTTKAITLLPAPVSAFGIATSGCAGRLVLVSDSSVISQGNIANWQWNLGDGSIVTNNNGGSFGHGYSNPGDYVATLVTTSAAGCKSDTAKRFITIAPKPTAKFGLSGNICAGDSIRFSDSSTISPGNINGWNWNFGDGQTATYGSGNPFFHKYIAGGNYTVKLSVIAANGCTSDTFSLPVTVTAKPTLSFTATGLPCVDSSYTFTSSIQTSASPATWYWLFGDGQSANSSTSNIIIHAYATAANNIQAKHVVTFAGGCSSDTATTTIPLINTNPSASFTIVSDTLCAGRNVLFNGSSTNTNLIWRWNFNNTLITSTPPVNYAFTNAGTYAVSLMVKNNSGCGSPVTSQNITIHANPSISAGADKIINLGTSVILDAFINNASNYDLRWSPPVTLSNPNILSPVASPTIATQYFITATDKQFFCSSTDDVTVKVISKLEVPNAFSPNGDGINDTWKIKGIELYPDATVTIFNRYGQMVFSAQRNYSNNPWSGTMNSKDLPVGTYYYIINQSQDSEQLAGYVMLLR
jgi:gliding motility-associated-like protein